MSETQQPTLTYKDAGVDISAGNQLVDNIKSVAKATHGPEVLGGLGGFGALYQLPIHKYKQPVLVSGTDGVGTKLKLALKIQKHDTIGIDLVAMCANDLIVCGAQPLYFLDYYATAKLDVAAATDVVKGIAEGCQQADMALIGGETAELPGMYHGEDYDLAGFCVGIVDKPKIIDGSDIQANDVLIGIASSGPHSNGYSLIRKILDISNTDLNDPFEDSTIGETLLAPTRIYVKSIMALLEKVNVKAMAHITGGGITENLPRVLPDKFAAEIQSNSWQMPAIFQWLQQQGNIDSQEMLRTFNCGIGMVLVVSQQDVDICLSSLQSQGERACKLGKVQTNHGDMPRVTYR